MVCLLTRFAQDLALYDILDVRVPPRTTSPRQTQDLRVGGLLEPHRERALAEAFAYLSAISIQSDQVTAACIEESADSKALTVLVAINMKASDGARSKTLDTIRTGFETILRTLNCSRYGKPSISTRATLSSY